MIRRLLEHINSLLSDNTHNYLLLTLAALYSGTATAMLVLWIRCGMKPEMELLKDIGSTLIWWGGIVAGAHSSKQIATTMKAAPKAGE